MHRARRPLAIAVCLAAALAACGSDDETTTTTTTIDAAADQVIVDDAVITLDDLPDGFEGNDPSADDEDDDTAPDECFEEAGVDPDDLDDAKVVEGDKAEFQLVTDEVLVGITVRITSFDDTDAPRTNLRTVTDADFLDCAVESIEQSSADEGQEVGEVSAEAIDPPVDAADAAAVRLEFETQGLPTVVEQHLLLIGRFGIAFQILTVNQDPDEDLVADLLQTMIDRIEAATG